MTGIRWLACAVAALLIAAGPRQPPQDPPTERRAALLQAVLVLKLASYLALEDEPAARRRDYRIGVVGHDEVVAAAIRNLPGKMVGNLPVAVVAVDAATAAGGPRKDGPGDRQQGGRPKGEDPEPQGPDRPAYDLLYIGDSVDAAMVARIIANHQKVAVPLVSERRGFVASGGGIQLFVQDNGVRFEVNAAALKQQGIRASPQLMKLSKEAPR